MSHSVRRPSRVPFSITGTGSQTLTQVIIGELTSRQPVRITGILAMQNAGGGATNVGLYLIDNPTRTTLAGVSPGAVSDADCVMRSDSASPPNDGVESFVSGPLGGSGWAPIARGYLAVTVDVAGSGPWNISGYVETE